MASGFQSTVNLSDANHFVLSGWPFVRSIGQDVADGMSFAWMPGELPFYAKKGAQMFVDRDENSKIDASRVREQYAPFFH